MRTPTATKLSFMVLQAVLSVWNAPAPAPPRAVRVARWDLVIAAACAVLGVWQAFAESSAPWRPVAIALSVALPWTLLIRRRRPLLAFVVGFAPGMLVELAAVISQVPWKAGASGLFVLLLAYSLFRWGSGRDAIKGFLLLVLIYGVTVLKGDIQTFAEAVAAVVFLLLAPAIGVAFRFRAATHRQALDHVRLAERQQLARELHDTVAHHVSAIAIQAQAGRAVATARPEAAVNNLLLIEEAASRTLIELRTIVGALRDRDEAEREPQRGIRDLASLDAGPDIAVELALRGQLDNLRPSMEAAVFRLAQESVTNAARHAANVSRIDVLVTGSARSVEVVITDNGDVTTGQTADGGYGLVGMKERVTLLRGTFSAGPCHPHGWRVEAVLPRAELSS